MCGSEIKIKLSKVLTPKEFEKLRNELWEYFGNIGKNDITIDFMRKKLSPGN